MEHPKSDVYYVDYYFIDDHCHHDDDDYHDHDERLARVDRTS